MSAPKPGDVAMVNFGDREERAFWEGYGRNGDRVGRWMSATCGQSYAEPDDYRPLVVIDPEDREQVERLAEAYCSANPNVARMPSTIADRLTNALHEFADPKPVEPTDPKAWVTDRRENVWRLLADGDWVCTSGPDVGEYLVWAKLAADRGPLEVEVTP